MVAISPASQIKNIDTVLAHCEYKCYANRSTVIYAGDRCESLFIIIKGSVTIVIENEEGKELIIAYLNEGDFFGELGIFNPDNNELMRSAGVLARGECELAEISYDKLRNLIAQDISILYTLGEQVANHLRKTTKKVSDLAFMDVTGRIAGVLLDLCKQPDAMTHPDGMQIKATRQEIARIAGCSREMVGRVLKDMEEQGLVHVQGKTMVIYGTR